jgi:hypothetical protein
VRIGISDRAAGGVVDGARDHPDRLALHVDALLASFDQLAAQIVTVLGFQAVLVRLRDDLPRGVQRRRGGGLAVLVGDHRAGDVLGDELPLGQLEPLAADRPSVVVVLGPVQDLDGRAARAVEVPRRGRIAVGRVIEMHRAARDRRGAGHLAVPVVRVGDHRQLRGVADARHVASGVVVQADRVAQRVGDRAEQAALVEVVARGIAQRVGRRQRLAVLVVRLTSAVAPRVDRFQQVAGVVVDVAGRQIVRLVAGRVVQPDDQCLAQQPVPGVERPFDRHPGRIDLADHVAAGIQRLRGGKAQRVRHRLGPAVDVVTRLDPVARGVDQGHDAALLVVLRLGRRSSQRIDDRVQVVGRVDQVGKASRRSRAVGHGHQVAAAVVLVADARVIVGIVPASRRAGRSP